jgi:hypothetical protein
MYLIEVMGFASLYPSYDLAPQGNPNPNPAQNQD